MINIEKIKTEVNNLCKDSHNRYNLEYNKFTNDEFNELMKYKYKYLYENSSTLFEQCIKGDINLQRLDFMLEMIAKVNNGADYNTTSTVVGQHLVDVYVKPLISQDNHK